MSGKHDRTEPPSWRPSLAQKLSGLVVRHNSAAKTKKAAPETAAATNVAGAPEKSAVSVFKFKKEKKSASPDGPLEFEPLEVDLNKLESIRLSDGWLEPPRPQEPNGGQEQQQQQQPSHPATDNSTTPIADLFASRSVLNRSDSENSQSSSYYRGRSSSRPFSMFDTQPGDYASIRGTSSSGSILDRGRPVEPRRYVSDPPKKPTDWRQVPPPLVAEDGTLPKRDIYSSSSSLLQPPKPAEKNNNRHSMYAGVPPPALSAAPARTKTPTLQAAPAAARSASATPLDRVQTWQKSVTSMPPPPAPSASTSALAPGVAPTTQAARRVPAVRGGLGNRLAWIRELEEKKSSSANKDVGFKKPQASGSVSDKLAMFESKQASSSSRMMMPPPTRSNSTTSRLSSVGLESSAALSAYGGDAAATPRTSIDTARSSHRASSVMGYYDDSFREKMESIVGDYAAADKDQQQPDAQQQKPKVTTQFVPVKTEKGPEEPVKAEEKAEEKTEVKTEVKAEEKVILPDANHESETPEKEEARENETENLTSNEA